MPPVTLTNSQQAALRQSTAEPRILIELHTKHGTYYLANERVKWSGQQYQPRLANEPQLITAIGGTQGFGLSPTKTIDILLANADGWVSTQPPEFYRYGDMIVKEVLLDVTSTPLRTYRFMATGGAMNAGGETFQVHGEEFWTTLKKRVFPSNNTLITKQRFPNFSDLAFKEDSPRENTPMNIITGRVMSRLTLLEPFPTDQDTGGLEWLVGYGSVAIAPEGKLFQFPQVNNQRDFQVYDASTYQIRYRRTFDGVPYTALFVYPTGEDRTGNDAQITYLDTRDGKVFGYPDEFLLFMLTDSIAGVGLDPTLIDSDSLLTARSWYRAHDMTMDASIYTQRTLEEWLQNWSRDSLTHLVFRDKIYLYPQRSIAAVGSFYLGNIQNDTLSTQDALIGQEQSRVAIEFRDRLKDEGAMLRIRYDVGSGSDYAFTSDLIGRPTVAAKVAQTLAKRAYFGIRRYDFGSTIRQTALSEGDLVSFTHPSVLTSADGPQLMEIEAIRRQPSTGLLGFTLREIDYRVFKFGNVAADAPVTENPCRRTTTQFVYAPTSWGFVSSGVNDTLVLTHTLKAPIVSATYRYPPTRLYPQYYGWSTTYPWSLDLTEGRDAYNTNSTVPMRLLFPFSGYVTLNGSLFANFGNQGYQRVGFYITTRIECAADGPPPDRLPAVVTYQVVSAWFGPNRVGDVTGNFTTPLFNASGLWATPFFVQRSGTTIDGLGTLKLATDVDSLGTFAIAIYESVSTRDIVPGNQYSTVANFQTNTPGFFSDSITPCVLASNRIYWLVTAVVSAQGGTFLNAGPLTGYGLTIDATAEFSLGWRVVSYGLVLPSTFPVNSPAEINGSNVAPAVFWHVCS
jgi:hypothetical protein